MYFGDTAESAKKTRSQPTIIAGPCMAESAEVVDDIASFLNRLAEELGFRLVFKASFDKANRTSVHSDRGPGMEQGLELLSRVKNKYGCAILTDIHVPDQAERAASVVDILQIPAFLCRQTDLLVAAVHTGKAVNVKKGQFLPPQGADHIRSKVLEAAKDAGVSPDFAVTERGTSFGYGDLIVDPRGFQIMSSLNCPVVFDVTHSLQRPAGQATTGGAREFAGSLTRAAIATGYVDALFLEVHPNPEQAKSDAATQLNKQQAEKLLRQAVPMLKESAGYLL